MSRLFNLDSPIMVFLSKMADLLILNLLTLICCIPIITIGASMTAMSYVTLKMVRDEECYIAKDFFKSFKQNFKQATIIWIIMLLIILVIAGDYCIIAYSGIEFYSWMKILLYVVTFMIVLALMHVFPVLARFDNTIRNTFKNSMLMGIMTLPKTVLMVICWLIPTALAFFVPYIMPLTFCFGLSGPSIMCAALYNKTFKRFEPDVEQPVPDEEWTVAVDDEESDK